MIASTVALLLRVMRALRDLQKFGPRSGKTMTRKDLATLAEIIGNQSTAALTYGDKDTAKEILAALSAKKHIVAAALYDKDGRLLASYSGSRAQAAALPVRAQPDAVRFENGALVLFHEIRLDGDFAGTVYLKSDLQEVNDRFVRYAGIILLFMVASWLVTLFLSSQLAAV